MAELSTGIQAPDFTLVDVHGNTVRLADYRGRFVVLAILRGFF